jgi:hypothetical protein
VVIVFVVTILSVTAIAISIEDGARASTMIGLILAPLTTVLGILAVFGKVSNLETRMGDVQSDTRDLTNGLLDAKVRAAVADVIGPELVHEEAREQVALDRERRAQKNAAADTATTLLVTNALPEV